MTLDQKEVELTQTNLFPEAPNTKRWLQQPTQTELITSQSWVQTITG